ncbi:predicted protein [Chaetoceros tenuissimus]|uniref:Uncharacterized protein n=1 Tax=Chaetoceros tenuissimus TaxID=426638 RepID=A0AAD3H0X9_9STRA|nr:predicted protein [Chaetoceros tenuissimus]
MDRPSFVDVVLVDQSAITPKQAVHIWFGELKKKKGLVFDFKKCFVTWEDVNSASNGTRFTSVFIEPLTLEKFMSGKWVCTSYTTSLEPSLTCSCYTHQTPTLVEVVWFSSKRDAEQAAAAKFLDCSYFRDGKSLNLCRDDPYEAIQNGVPLSHRPFPSSVPRIICEAEAKALLHAARLVMPTNVLENLLSREQDMNACLDNTIYRQYLQTLHHLNYRIICQSIMREANFSQLPAPRRDPVS